MQDKTQALAARYDAEYYAHGLGRPYRRGAGDWEAFFGRVADFIVAEYAPRTVLDAGCAIGFLVEALRERGVDARGFDISEYAISQVPDELRPYCVLGSITGEIDGNYDLITCIEVLEHLPPEQAEQAIDNLGRHTHRILFSSTPEDDREPTHLNVQQPDAWVCAFAARGFFPRPTTATAVLSPQAMIFDQREATLVDEVAAYEAVRYRLARDLQVAETKARGEIDAAAAERVRVTELEQRLHATEDELQGLKGRVVYAETASTRSADELEELRGTTWWRIGRPFRHVITVLRGSPMRLLLRGTSGHGPRIVAFMKPLVPVRMRRAFRQRFPAVPDDRTRPATSPISVDDLVAHRLPLLRPLRVFPIPNDGRRYVTVVTDSISAGSLFGGVGTSMILAAMLARRLDASLRLVTRTEPPDPSNFGTVLRAHEIEWNDNLESSYSPMNAKSSLPFRHGEVVVTTSWWSTWAALRSVDPNRIIYLLQEDERLFYPAGDEQVACSEVLFDERIRFLINTSLLYQHFVNEGFANIARNGLAFEPAFPMSTYFRETERKSDRRAFFFYARPDNVRNLFLLGLEAVKESVARGVLDRHWDVHFVGSRIPPLKLPHGLIPRRSENLPWPKYAALLRRVDVGLSLVSTPHPSYPPLDLAACGAVAVTNRFGLKQSLNSYSRNIICADLSRMALVDGISDAVALAADEARRAANYKSQALSRSWESSLATVLDELSSTL